MKKVSREHKLETRRKWRERNKDRIKKANDKYISKNKEELKIRRVLSEK